MPWTAVDAPKHTHRARGKQAAEVWARVANESLTRTKDDATAIREANAAVERLHTVRKAMGLPEDNAPLDPEAKDPAQLKMINASTDESKKKTGAWAVGMDATGSFAGGSK